MANEESIWKCLGLASKSQSLEATQLEPDQSPSPTIPSDMPPLECDSQSPSLINLFETNQLITNNNKIINKQKQEIKENKIYIDNQIKNKIQLDKQIDINKDLIIREQKIRDKQLLTRHKLENQIKNEQIKRESMRQGLLEARDKMDSIKSKCDDLEKQVQRLQKDIENKTLELISINKIKNKI